MKNDELNAGQECWSIETQAVRTGTVRSHQREHSEAIYLTSSYAYDSAHQAQAIFTGEEEGNAYSRYNNPSVRMFEERLAALEGGEQACAVSSGMAAIAGVCMSLLETGDHVVCSRSVFGTTTTFFAKYLKRFGVSTTFVDLVDERQWSGAIQSNTRLLFLETPSNPLGIAVDLERTAELAHRHNALLVVDNCFCTPVLQQPLKLGADVVVHSTTKYIDGQGRCMGGAAVGGSRLMDEMQLWQRSFGACMSPFNAWNFHKSLETLPVRMEAHCRNAMAMAVWLEQHPAVERVYYAGLPSHPSHEQAKRQQSGFGGVLSFEVAGGREAAWRIIDGVRFISRTANLGDARTTITHPATTTHCRLSDEDKVRSGITEGLVRIAAGLENSKDLINDIRCGLEA